MTWIGEFLPDQKTDENEMLFSLVKFNSSEIYSWLTANFPLSCSANCMFSINLGRSGGFALQPEFPEVN